MKADHERARAWADELWSHRPGQNRSYVAQKDDVNLAAAYLESRETIARLQEWRDSAVEQISEFRVLVGRQHREWDATLAELKTARAERDAALAEVERLTRERDALLNADVAEASIPTNDDGSVDWPTLTGRWAAYRDKALAERDAAEAEVGRLRVALEFHGVEWPCKHDGSRGSGFPPGDDQCLLCGALLTKGENDDGK